MLRSKCVLAFILMAVVFSHPSGTMGAHYFFSDMTFTDVLRKLDDAVIVRLVNVTAADKVVQKEARPRQFEVIDVLRGEFLLNT